MTDKTGGKVYYIKNREAMCLTQRQVGHVYKVVEKGGMINIKTITCETTQIQDDNLYKKVVLNNVFKEKDESPEMRNWSIFSDNIRYVQHDQVTPQNLNVDTLDYREHKELYLKIKWKKGETLDDDFGLYPDIKKSRYLDLVEAWYSLEQYIGLKEDKLSSTTVDFIRSEGNLETKCLYWFSKPKMC